MNDNDEMKEIEDMYRRTIIWYYVGKVMQAAGLIFALWLLSKLLEGIK
jgi:hypothetical protein